MDETQSVPQQIDEAPVPPQPTVPETPSPLPVAPTPTPPPAYTGPITICANCHNIVPMGFSFCPNCGKQLKDMQLSVSTFSQTWIYLVSVFAPPLGFWPGVKYFRNPDPKAKKIGLIAIGLTVLSTIITLWLTFAFVNSYVGDLNSALNGTGISPASGIF